MKYLKFRIKNYRAIEDITIDIKKNKIVPLIGTNESGKTTILQAIYAFDFSNDKEYESRHINNVRNYYQPGKKEISYIEATVEISNKEFFMIIPEEYKEKYSDIEKFNELLISRNLESFDYDISIIEDKNDAKVIAKEIVKRLPYIIYNDDFIERPQNIIDIPEDPKSLYGWLGIYERAFSKAGYSIFDTVKENDINIRNGIISDVETEINKTLIKEWSRISLDNSNCLSIKLDIVNNQLTVHIVEKNGKADRFFKIEDRSKGFLWFFNFVMKIKYNPKSTGSNSDIIYLLDEPGSYLHSSAQEKLCKMIKEISVKEGIVIYCTHTHHLLDPKYIPPKYISIIKKGRNKEITINKITQLKTDFKKLSELQPVYEALDVSDIDFFFNRDKIILVEGIHDKYALELFTNLGDDNIIMPCVNAESIYSNLGRMIAYNKKYVAVWDNDDEGIEYFNKANNNYGKNESKRFLVLPNLYDKKKVRMEEMFNDNDFDKLSKLLGMPSNSSYSNIMTNLIVSSEETKIEAKKIVNSKTIESFDKLENDINLIK